MFKYIPFVKDKENDIKILLIQIIISFLVRQKNNTQHTSSTSGGFTRLPPIGYFYN